MNRVLIVDDEEEILKVLFSMAKRFGYVPLTASKPQTAISIFKKERPGIIVTDLMLNGDMDGIALCSWIRSKDRSAIMIAMSGYFSEYDREYCMAAGFSDFLVKPVSVADFNNALDCALSRRKRWLELPNGKAH